MDIQAQLQKGLQLHQAGHVADAAECYKHVLEADPQNVDALHLLSVVFCDAGNLDLAIALAQQAIHLQPEFIAPYISLGNALQKGGGAAQAAEVFRAALAVDPNQPEVHNNLASALTDTGDYEGARAEAEAAQVLNPELPEAYNNLGNALLGLGDVDGAVEQYGRALALRPDFTDAIFNLGNAEAKRGRFEKAVDYFRDVVLSQPQRVDAHYNMANALQKIGRAGEAVESYRLALAFMPDNVDILNNLGSALQRVGRVEDAIRTWRDALRGDGENAELHWNLALALLLNGDYDEGWREYEWRWRHPGTGLTARDFTAAQCDALPGEGRTVLLHAEQGHGDTLQFVRYIPHVAARGARVVLECQPGLTRLLSGMAGVEAVVAKGEALPEFDCHVPLLSLPGLFGTTLDSIPADGPYLSVPDGVAAPAGLDGGDGLKVGFAWGGSATHADDGNRSCPPDVFEALFDVPGATFYSLQVGRDEEWRAAWNGRDNVVDLKDGLSDFADTAAAVAQLDLVVCVDTAVGHLAGALGVPVHMMLPHAPTFVWMLDRDDSPWYPKHKLFRQPAPGDWAAVIAAVSSALKENAS